MYMLLSVDAESDLLAQWQRLLECPGSEVVTARDGRKTSGMSKPPGWAVLDAMMPIWMVALFYTGCIRKITGRQSSVPSFSNKLLEPLELIARIQAV